MAAPVSDLFYGIATESYLRPWQTSMMELYFSSTTLFFYKQPELDSQHHK